MKIIHTSDLHLDSPLNSRLSAEKSRLRKKELLRGFSSLLEKAKELSADSIIIAGDLFDSENISKRALDTVIFEISASPEISFFYLPGNHEKNAFLSSGRNLPKNLFIFGEDWTYFKAGDLVIAGRSRISEGLFNNLKLNPADKNIVVLHGELTDKSAFPDKIGTTDAAKREIDYMALGHYHTHTTHRLDTRGVAVYCGAPFTRGFDECGERGFVLIDSSRISEYKFLPFGERRSHIIPLDISSITDYGMLESECEKALSSISYKDIVRLEIAGEKSPELWLDTTEIETQYSERFFHFEVKNSSKLQVEKGDYRFDKTLKGEFVRLVCSREEFDEQTKEKIISTGLHALLGD